MFFKFFYLLFAANFVHLLAIETSPSLVPKDNWISDEAIRLDYARLLSYRPETRDSALAEYLLLLKFQPHNVKLLREISQVYIDAKRYPEALNLLYNALKQNPEDPDLLAATGYAEAVAGHAKQSRFLFEKALSHKKSDSLLVKYADAMMSWGDFLKAEKIYCQALKEDPHSVELLLKLGWVLQSSQRYESAESLFQRALFHHPNHPKLLEAMAKLKLEENEYEVALEYVERLIHVVDSPPNLLLKATILYKWGCWDEALDVYHQLLHQTSYQHVAGFKTYQVDAYNGIGLIYSKLDRDELADDSFKKALQLESANVEARFYSLGNRAEEEDVLNQIIAESPSVQVMEKWASLFLENGMPCKASYIDYAILLRDPEYFPAQIALAETLTTEFLFDSALDIYVRLLEIYPEDPKIMLAIARVLAWSKNYCDAIEWYDGLIQRNPQNPVLYREKARTALWAKKYLFAMETYRQALFTFDDYLIQKSIAIEWNSKRLFWEKCYLDSLYTHWELLRLRPYDADAKFEYGQLFCILKMCDYSKRVYAEMLEKDPNHKIVQMALERSFQQLEPALFTNYFYWREFGTGNFSQSQIRRERLDIGFEIPLSCRAHLRLIEHTWIEEPFFDGIYHPAIGPSLEADCVFSPTFRASANITYKDYFHKFTPRVTSYTHLYFILNEVLQMDMGLDKENEIYNFFSLKQGIQSIIAWITLRADINHKWNLETTYRHLAYNDRNSQSHVNVRSKYCFSDQPNLFSVILEGNYRDTSHDSITIFNAKGKIVDVIHPYWTPQKYFSGGIALEFHHDYDLFYEYCEMPQRYFEARVRVEDDTNDNPGIQFYFKLKHEWYNHWGLEFTGFAHRSKQWNAEGLWGTINYRF